jgi:hypothetical protein
VKTFLLKIIIPGFFLTGIASYGQQAIVPAGSNASSPSGSISYTIGQVGYTTQSGTDHSTAAGVQQPYEISVLDVTNPIYNGIALKAYPNPTSDYLILELEQLDVNELSYTVFDISGKLLFAEKITKTQTQIPFSKLPSGTYLVTVNASDKNAKTFKIIKK